MRNPLETIYVGNYRISVDWDGDAESPREDRDNMWTFICWHRRSNLGDLQLTSREFGSLEEIEAHLRKEHGARLIRPLYLYEHSGMTISLSPFSCPWDSGQVGYAFVSSETLRKEYSVKRITKAVEAKALAYLKGEIDEYDQYLTGQIYQYDIERLPEKCEECGVEFVDGECPECGDEAEGDTIDSLCGCYGLDYCIEEAKRQVEYLQKEAA